MKQLLKFLFLGSAVTLLVFSCKKESDHETVSSAAGVSEATSITATISGRAIDENNNPISDADVVINGQNASTDLYGLFTLKNISTNHRCIVSVTKTGYFSTTHAFMAIADTVNYVQVVLLSNAETHSFQSSAGGIFSLPDGSSVKFDPNGFVIASTGAYYFGPVHLSMRHLSPDEPNFGMMIPGGDLLGKNASSRDVVLKTFGMLGIEMKSSSGERLQLMHNTTATLTMPIALSQMSTAPFSIPLWYFDETTSLWKEEGSATRNGNNYVGTVSHFSWWNCDYPYDRAYIIGKVLDCNSVPIPNVVVTVNGLYTLTTDQGGVYSRWVPAGIPLTVQVLASNNSNMVLNSQVENVPALIANQSYYVPDLIVPCPSRILGTLKTCSGSAVSGSVSITWNGGFSYRYTNDGQFNIVCPASSPIGLNASSTYNSSHYTYSGQYTSPALGNITDIGDIMLCSQVTALTNDFTINGGPFLNQHFIVDTTSSTASLYNGVFDISSTGNSLPYHISLYDLYLCNTASGLHPWNSGCVQTDVYFEFFNSQHYYRVYSYFGTGNTNLIYSGTYGDRVIGNFSGSGTCFEDSTSTSYPVTVSGNFDVTRH